MRDDDGDVDEKTLTLEERKILESVARHFGRPLTVQEVNLALDQARAFGEI